MLSTLMYLLVALLIIGLIAWVCRVLLPEPFARIASVVCAVIAVIVVIYALIGLLSGTGASLALAAL